jgi:NAD(P)-dependent dehydrogenase (short-subunit alcohol dehydrogenase family)
LDSFEGKLAVLTGGGSGMGRELVVQLAGAGCSVAACDLNPASVEETIELARKGAAAGVLITAHTCDVSSADAVEAFRSEVVAEHEVDHVNLLFNNAGIYGAGSFLTDDRAAWERVFNVCWGGVYNCSRAFMPLLVASDEGYIVNTSSINGFWATHGEGMPSTSYGTAKFAIKGFSEALIEDLRINAPHVKVAVVMPGSIGTGIVGNSTLVRGDADEFELLKEIPASTGFSLVDATPEELDRLRDIESEIYRELAGMTAAEAASVILDALRKDQWRILVGEDARELDRAARADPESIYRPDFRGQQTPGWEVPILMLRVLFDAQVDPDLQGAGIELRHGDETVALQIGENGLTATRGSIDSPNATVDVAPQTLHRLIVGDASLDRLQDDAIAIRGDEKLLDRVLKVVRRHAAPPQTCSSRP